MSEAVERHSGTRATSALGWAVALLYSAHAVLTVQMPRVEKTSALRETLRSWHYLIGLVLFVLLAWLLWRWYRDHPARPVGLSPAGANFGRQAALVGWALLLVMPLFGLLQAWTEGLVVRLGPLFALPTLLEESHVGWMFSGYMHSALGFSATLLFFLTTVGGGWLWLRHGVGLLRAFPAGFGFLAWFASLLAIYAVNSFREPQPGLVAAGIFIGLTALVAVTGWLIHRRGPSSRSVPPPAGMPARAASGTLLAVFVGLGLYMPYQMFGVTPWPMGEVVEAPADMTWHQSVVTTVTVHPGLPGEAAAMESTYRWCRFCHTVDPGQRHLAGPNLHAIFGQQAGTVPNFWYSTAMAEAGRQGLVWDDEAMDAFLADPQKFIPGNRMIMSIGPVRSAEERAAVINILKRETMPEAYWTPPSPAE
ncbi:MAG: hypothetical protein JJT85_03055 [Chromatiales bacterium]|nr:hypothetical protein [Chromatiales bacterium]